MRKKGEDHVALRLRGTLPGRLILCRDPSGVQITVLIGEKWEFGYTLCRYSHATRGTIDMNPIGER